MGGASFMTDTYRGVYEKGREIELPGIEDEILIHWAIQIPGPSNGENRLFL
jgi:hypothetical protein